MNILSDKTINGRDVSIYETEDGITLDIKHPCGELILFTQQESKT
jgi:hypothetical protein